MIGYDDLPDSSFSIPPLTTPKQDYERIGKAAVNNLMAAARKEQDNSPVLLKCPLVIRGSSGPVFQGKHQKARSRGKGTAQSRSQDFSRKMSTDGGSSRKQKTSAAKNIGLR